MNRIEIENWLERQDMTVLLIIQSYVDLCIAVLEEDDEQ